MTMQQVTDLLVEAGAATQMRLRSLEDAHDLIGRLASALEAAQQRIRELEQERDEDRELSDRYPGRDLSHE